MCFSVSAVSNGGRNDGGSSVRLVCVCVSVLKLRVVFILRYSDDESWSREEENEEPISYTLDNTSHLNARLSNSRTQSESESLL